MLLLLLLFYLAVLFIKHLLPKLELRTLKTAHVSTYTRFLLHIFHIVHQSDVGESTFFKHRLNKQWSSTRTRPTKRDSGTTLDTCTFALKSSRAAKRTNSVITLRGSSRWKTNRNWDCCRRWRRWRASSCCCCSRVAIWCEVCRSPLTPTAVTRLTSRT